MPQWAGSCWYYLRYLDPANDQQFVDSRRSRSSGWRGPATAGRVGGVDLYIGGVEHAVLHLLYARFWHKVLVRPGLCVDPRAIPAPVQPGLHPGGRLHRPGGPVRSGGRGQETPDGLAYQGEPVRRHSGKMGKSLKNSVSPDEIYESYGADTLRMYEMAMGPLDADRPWQPDDIAGVYRFLQRLWRNIMDEEDGETPGRGESAAR